jgi:hypothetical protein
LTVNAPVATLLPQATRTGTRPTTSLAGIATLIQPLGIACETFLPAIVRVSLHDSRGVVKIVTLRPGAMRVGEIVSLSPEEAPACDAHALRATSTAGTSAQRANQRRAPADTQAPIVPSGPFKMI